LRTATELTVEGYDPETRPPGVRTLLLVSEDDEQRPDAVAGQAVPRDASDGAAPASMGLPSVGDLVRWSAALGGEVARLPSTAARARRVVAVLPEHLEELVDALDRFTHLLDRSLGEVRDEVRDVGGRIEALQASIDSLAASLGTTTTGIDAAMPALSDAVVRLEERLEGMDHLLGELGGTVVGTINAVPGLRRVSRRGTPKPSGS
jgi:ABC-type transporter Mla subunit MlaD